MVADIQEGRAKDRATHKPKVGGREAVGLVSGHVADDIRDLVANVKETEGGVSKL